MASIIQSIANDEKIEGSSLVFRVNLNTETDASTLFPFNLSGGLGDNAASTDDWGEPQFDSGVTYDPVTSTITVPSGIRTFTVTVPIIDDSTVEEDEILILTIGGVTGTGVIKSISDKPSVQITSPTCKEAEELEFVVTLSTTPTTPVEYSFKIEPITATLDYLDYGFPKFTDGVIYNSSEETITVLPGTTKFKIFLPTVQNVISEPDEQLKIKIDTYEGIGTIEDEQPTVAIFVDAPALKEGDVATFFLKLDRQSLNDTIVNLEIIGPTSLTVQNITQIIPALGWFKTFTVGVPSDVTSDGVESIAVTILDATTNEKELVITKNRAVVSVLDLGTDIIIIDPTVPEPCPAGDTLPMPGLTTGTEAPLENQQFGDAILGFSGDIEFNYSEHFNRAITALEKMSQAMTLLANNSSFMAQKLCEIEIHQRRIKTDTSIIAAKHVELEAHVQKIRELAEDDGIHMRRPHEWLTDGSSFHARTKLDTGDVIRTDVVLRNTGNDLFYEDNNDVIPNQNNQNNQSSDF